MVEIKTFYCNLLRECTYVVYDGTGECIIIDSGCIDENEADRVDRFVTDKGLNPVKLFLTHGHFDHISGIPFMAERWSMEYYAHNNEISLFPRYIMEGKMLGYGMKDDMLPFAAVSDNNRIHFGNTCITVLETPGHSAGGVCYYIDEDGVLFSGDTLFQGSIGRTDLYAGDYEQLMRSITTKLMTLPDDVRVYPGHGYPTTIGEERRSNPFLSR